MINLSKYRIVDLSHEMVPGEQKIDGHYLHGEPFFGRSVEVQEFMAYGARMHFIQSQTHNGTHCEGAYKYLDEGPDMAGMPLASYIGEAVVCDLSHKGLGEGVRADEFRRAGVKSGDIVLVRTNPEHSGELPYFEAEVLDFLYRDADQIAGLKRRFVLRPILCAQRPHRCRASTVGRGHSHGGRPLRIGSTDQRPRLFYRPAAQDAAGHG